MSTMTEQLDLFTDGYCAVVPIGGSGHDYRTRGGGWRIRWLGTRFGWAFHRAVGDGWESWEPDLPFGVAHVLDRTHAIELVTALADRLGDDPNWLHRRVTP